jgi:tetratricopeptide (TPR) repeat protein
VTKGGPPVADQPRRFSGQQNLQPSADVAVAFQKALKFHQQGRLADAEALYRAVLAQAPEHFDALHGLGIIYYLNSQPASALELIERAIAINPSVAAAHSHRGVSLQALGRLGEALASHDRALQIKPDYAEAFNNRGSTLFDLKRSDEALASYDRALQLKANYAEAFNNRGNALLDLKRPEEALVSYDRALQFNPDYVEALNNRGNALLDLKRPGEALVSYDRALQLRPNFAQALSNRGNALRELNRSDEALASYDRALVLKPNYAHAHNNRGHALRDLRHLNEAIASFDRAVDLMPDYAEAHYVRGMVNLLLGRYGQGWVDYEWRWKDQSNLTKRPEINGRGWRGENLEGCRIAIYHEQGVGDVIQFVRYLPLLVERGAKVTFLAPANLIRLLRAVTSQIVVVSSLDHQESFDFKCALMSLPLRFGTEASSIPNRAPYLNAEPQLSSRWKEKIAGHGVKIGIAWQGSPAGRIDRGRSIPLAHFSPLSQLPGVRLISLQKAHGLNQIATLPAGSGVETLGDELDGGPDSFIDTAAVMSNLDLVITSDTSIAHLAGALGRPTWVALKYVPDWRWLLDRGDSPWYPTMRLFRQETEGDWKFVFARIAQELRSYRVEG